MAVALAACQPTALPGTQAAPSPSPALPATATATDGFYRLPPDWPIPLRLKLGETATLAHGGLHVTFVAVPEDTRCAGLACASPGNVQVKLWVARVDDPAGGEAMLLNTRPDLPLGAWYIGYSIVLKSVEPARPPVSQKEYVIWINVLTV
jgi:hypothetical protein